MAGLKGETGGAQLTCFVLLVPKRIASSSNGQRVIDAEPFEPPIMDRMDSFMTAAEVAALCRTPVETVRYWRHIGKGPASFKVGRRVLYATTDVEAWLTGLKHDAR